MYGSKPQAPLWGARPALEARPGALGVGLSAPTWAGPAWLWARQKLLGGMLPKGSIYVYICMYVYIHVYMCICRCMQVYLCTNVCMYVFTCICVCVCIHVHVYVHIYLLAHLHVYNSVIKHKHHVLFPELLFPAVWAFAISSILLGA